METAVNTKKKKKETFTNHYTHKFRNGESLAAKCVKTECLFISVIFKRMFQVKLDSLFTVGSCPRVA